MATKSRKENNAPAQSEREILEAKFNAAADAAARDEIYLQINSKFNDDRSVGRPKFVKGHTYAYESDQLGFFKDSKGKEHAYIEVTFRDLNTQLTTSTSIGFWRKSVAQKAGPARGNTYESTKCDGLGSSDMQVLHALRNGAQITCSADPKQVASGLSYNDNTKSWTGVASSTTWVYEFQV